MRRSREPRPADVRAAAGLIAAGLLLGGVASVLLRTAGDLADPAVATAAAKPAARPAPAPATKPAPAPAAARPVAAPSGPSSAPAPAAVKVSGVRPVAHLDDHVTYQYNALGRRDPFQPMIGGEFIGEDVGGDAPVDIGGIKVVGVVWGASDRFALVEDGRGGSMVLRVGDKVMNGVVEQLKRDALVVKLTVDDQTQSVTIPVTRKGDSSNAKR